MNKEKKLSPSMEDYLEAILALEKRNRVARVKDIAQSLGVQMPSVSGALKNLKLLGLVDYERNSFIVLTGKGKEIALTIQDRHTVLTTFLEEILFLSREKAESQACKMEHIIDAETALRLQNCVKTIKEDLFTRGDYSSDRWSRAIQEKHEDI